MQISTLINRDEVVKSSVQVTIFVYQQPHILGILMMSVG